MTTTSTPLLGVTGGVSQRPPAQRRPDQCRVQDNADASPSEGLSRRRPTEHIAQVYPAAAPLNVAFGAINRSTTERYVTVVHNRNLKVFGVDGTEHPVHAPGGGDPDFSYLDCRRSNRVLNPETFSDWLLTDDAVAPVATTTPSPVGHGAAAELVADRDASANPNAIYSRQLSSVFTWTVTPKNIGVACWFKDTNDATRQRPKVQLMNIALGGNAVFRWDDGVLELDSITDGTATTVTAGVQKGPDGWYRAVMVMQWTAVGGLGAIQLVLSPPDDDDGTDMDVHAFGYQIAQDVPTDPALFPSYMIEEPRAAIRSLPVADFTFFTNRTKTVAMSAGTTGPRFPSQDVGGSPVTDLGFVFVRQGGFGERYRARGVRTAGSSFDVEIETVFDPGIPNEPSGALQFQASNKIAQAIYNSLVISGSEWNPVWQGGSVVRLALTSGTISNLRADDSQGDTLMMAVRDEVKSVADLPIQCMRGTRVRVVGANDDDEDDYWVSFVPHDATAGFNPREGYWSETVAPNIPSGFDGATMPHQLVRRVDDATGSVTGVPGAIYFEWGPAAWSDRLVGDENTNPEPSFVGASVRDLLFYRGRLGLLTGDRVVLSEVGEFFNFWRTTVRALVDSDPVSTDTPHARVEALNAAVTVWDTLLVVSAGMQARVDGTPLLTPRTVSTSVGSEFENDPDVRPVVLDQTVLLAVPRSSLGAAQDDFAAVTEMYRVGDGDTFAGRNASEDVPAYLPGRVIVMASSPSAKAAMLVLDDDVSAVYVYRWSDDPAGRRVQSAWYRFTFPGADSVLGVVLIENTALLLIERDGIVDMERTTVAEYAADTGSSFIVHLDRRVSDQDLPSVPTYDPTTNRTTFVLPYSLSTSTAANVGVVVRGVDGGQQLIVAQASGSSVFVVGDHRGVPVFIGERYTTTFRLSQPVVRLRDGTPAATDATIVQGRLAYHDTASFDVDVSGTSARTASRSQYRAPGLALGSQIGTVVLSTGVLEFAVGLPSSEAVVEVNSSSVYPFRLQGVEWDLDVVGVAPIGRGIPA